MTTLCTQPQTPRAPAPAHAPPAPPSALEKPERLASLDAYRGFVMLLLLSGNFGIREVARRFPDSPTWQFLGFHTTHVAWVGFSFWDFIMPSFVFMVGVAMPYSYAARRARGESGPRTGAHVVLRSL